MHESSFMTSTIVNTEYLVIPFRVQDYEKVMEFEQFKRILNLEIIFVDNSVSTQAARIRAKYKGIREWILFILPRRLHTVVMCF